jgi:hypothetical protein
MKYILIITSLLLLTGCGESAKEYHENEARDTTVKSIEHDDSQINDRIKQLEDRVTALEKH